MATKFSPCKGSYVLNQFPGNVMFGMNGFHVSASGAIQGHHGPLVSITDTAPYELQILCTVFFPSHWLPSHITIIQMIGNNERGMNPATMAIINLQKKY